MRTAAFLALIVILTATALGTGYVYAETEQYPDLTLVGYTCVFPLSYKPPTCYKLYKR